MRRMLVAMAAIAVTLCSVSLVPQRAEAMTLPAPATLTEAIAALGGVEQVRYCRVRCGYYGCRRKCYYGGRRYYRPYRYYRYRRY